MSKRVNISCFELLLKIVKRIIYRLTSLTGCMYLLCLYFTCETLTILKMDKKTCAVNICFPDGLMSCHRPIKFRSRDRDLMGTALQMIWIWLLVHDFADFWGNKHNYALCVIIICYRNGTIVRYCSDSQWYKCESTVSLNKSQSPFFLTLRFRCYHWLKHSVLKPLIAKIKSVICLHFSTDLQLTVK